LALDPLLGPKLDFGRLARGDRDRAACVVVFVKKPLDTGMAREYSSYM
jgi:hypothetical protein